MRALVLSATLALFGFAASQVPNGDRELRISTPHHGVVVEALPGQPRAVTLGGPRVSIVIPEGTEVRFNDLNRAEVSARIDWENEWMVWEGSYEVELVEDGEVKRRLRVQDATMVLGHFDQGEGWMTASG